MRNKRPWWGPRAINHAQRRPRVALRLGRGSKAYVWWFNRAILSSSPAASPTCVVRWRDSPRERLIKHVAGGGPPPNSA
eukprot:scaffold1987_cov377-Prasinococcus_capsulatus_cf.AAC.13